MHVRGNCEPDNIAGQRAAQYLEFVNPSLFFAVVPGRPSCPWLSLCSLLDCVEHAPNFHRVELT